MIIIVFVSGFENLNDKNHQASSQKFKQLIGDLLDEILLKSQGLFHQRFVKWQPSEVI